MVGRLLRHMAGYIRRKHTHKWFSILDITTKRFPHLPLRTLTQLSVPSIHDGQLRILLQVIYFLSLRFWLEVSKESPRDIAKKLKDEGMSIAGHQDSSTINVLNKYIPVAAALGGMIIGLISIFSDLVGAIGSGTGILLAVSIIYGYYEKLVK